MYVYRRTLKQSLYAIDTALREQTAAIERLSKTVEVISENQRQATAYRPQNVGRVPNAAHSWDLFGGFVLALVLQALLKWIFNKDWNVLPICFFASFAFLPDYGDLLHSFIKKNILAMYIARLY